MKTFAFIETPEGLDVSPRPADEVVFVSDNPILAYRFASAKVLDADRLVGQDEANRLGAVALQLAEAVDTALRNCSTKHVCGVPVDEIRLAGVTSRLFAGNLHRTEALRRAVGLVEPDIIEIRVTEQLRFDTGQPLLPPRFASPARSLADSGFFGSLRTSVTMVPFQPPRGINDTASDDLMTRIMILPPEVISYEARKYLPIGRSRKYGAAKIFVAGLNEVVREALPFLSERGFEMESCGKLMTGPPASGVTFTDVAPIDTSVEQSAGICIDAILRESTGYNDVERKALIRVFCQHLTAGLRNMAVRRDLIDDAVSRLAKRTNGATVVLSNGLFGPYGALAYAAAKRHGVIVVDAEHGVTTGLAALSQAKINYSEAATSDVLLCSSKRAADAFSKCRRSEPLDICVVGLADQTRRTYRPKIQRFWSRRRLGLGRHDTAVMHISTLPSFGNLRPGLTAPAESTSFDLERTLIEDVYAKTPARVLYKPYPTQRFPYEPAIQDVLNVPSNVSIMAYEDFRYTRCAADILVSMTPTSTLGWCVGAGRPLIWLHTARFNTLLDDDLADKFSRAFFVIDIDRRDWTEKFVDLLSMPMSAIRDEWQKKQSSRRDLLELDICGPSGRTGQKVAEIIDDIVKSHRYRRVA